MIFIKDVYQRKGGIMYKDIIYICFSFPMLPV